MIINKEIEIKDRIKLNKPLFFNSFIPSPHFKKREYYSKIFGKLTKSKRSDDYLENNFTFFQRIHQLLSEFSFYASANSKKGEQMEVLSSR